MMVCQAQPYVVDGRKRTTDDPCGTMCSFPDFRAWKEIARFEVARALQTPGISGEVKAELERYGHAINTMDESWISNGNNTRALARMAQQANCLAMGAQKSLPSLDEVSPPLSIGVSLPAWIPIALAVGVGLYLWRKF